MTLTLAPFVLVLLAQAAERSPVSASQEPASGSAPLLEAPAVADSAELELQDAGAEPEGPRAPDPAAADSFSPQKPPRGRSLFRGALEVAAHALPSGTPGGEQDLFAYVLPLLSVDTGDDFGFELGGALRIRLLDAPPAQRAEDHGGFLRREDWDERSDFGQLLRELWLGSEDSRVRLRAGPLRRLTLGRGLLINRYSNRLNPNYHPAGGVATFDGGPFQAQALASDLLAPRLFAAQLTGDVADLLGVAAQRGRFHVTVSAGHDFGSAGGETSPISVAILEADAGIYQGQGLRLFGYGAVGSRLLTTDVGLGAALGLSADGALGTALLGGRLEARKIGGGFRFGMFGPAHELARFTELGFSGHGLAEARLPDGFSGYGELQVELGLLGELGQSRRGALVVSAAAEYFSWGRLDLDATVTGRLPSDVASFSGRLTVVGLNELPRYQAAGEVRYRLAPSFYVFGHGGVAFFPQPDRSLVRGPFAGVGVGADFSH